MHCVQESSWSDKPEQPQQQQQQQEPHRPRYMGETIVVDRAALKPFLGQVSGGTGGQGQQLMVSVEMVTVVASDHVPTPLCFLLICSSI